VRHTDFDTVVTKRPGPKAASQLSADPRICEFPVTMPGQGVWHPLAAVIGPPRIKRNCDATKETGGITRWRTK
jgi:hypothetical protein